MIDLRERTLLGGAIALTSELLVPRGDKAQSTKTRLILLDTGVGPPPRKANSAPAQVIISHNTAYVVDCGDGVARQLALADARTSSCEK
jgi:hypothetical protein